MVYFQFLKPSHNSERKYHFHTRRFTELWSWFSKAFE